MIDNGNNEIRGGRVERDAGGDEKQLIKFAWPYMLLLIILTFKSAKQVSTSRVMNQQ